MRDSFAVKGKILILRTLLLCAAATYINGSTRAQSIAVLTPDQTETSTNFSRNLESAVGDSFKVLDFELAKAVFESHSLLTPYNPESSQARNLGSAIGSEYMILIKGDTLRRASIEKPDYHEAYAAVFLVSSRSGLLVAWNLYTGEAATPADAETKLSQSAAAAARLIQDEISKDESLKSEAAAGIEDIDDPNTDTRPPLPYKRIKPEYTTIANLYGIDAIVDIEAAIDENGAVGETRVVRWAGFGLDESVEKAVREMQWRPADRKGKTFAMKVLLRYNFKDIENPVD